jgi:diketogulonate reductase-like aldo/keto reductase
VLKEIAAKHNKTVAQVAIKFQSQRGVVAIPKSTHKERMIENMNIFDFELTQEDMAKIAKLNKHSN